MSETQQSGGAMTHPSEPRLVEYVVLLAVADEQSPERTYWEPLGSISAATRPKALEMLQEGVNAPQIPLDAGEAGEMRLVPASAWGEPVPVEAQARVVMKFGLYRAPASS